MRKDLFNAIKTKLASDVPEVKHIDLWNHNVEFIEQEDMWERPAVFVEFGKIEWAPFQGGSQRGRGIVTIHLVTDWTEGGHDAAFDLSHRVYKALDGLSGESFNERTVADGDEHEPQPRGDTGEHRQLCRALPVAIGCTSRKDEAPTDSYRRGFYMKCYTFAPKKDDSTT